MCKVVKTALPPLTIMKKKITVLITGPLPPPAGGISIHIWRLKQLLEDEFTIDLIDESPLQKEGYFNIRSLKIFTYLKKMANADLLYVQSGNKLLKKIHIATGRLMGKKILITIHGYGPKRKFPFNIIDAAFFNMANKIILVNDDIHKKVSLQKNKCVTKHAFLPPEMNDEPALPNIISEQIKIARQNNKVLLCANASRLDIHHGQDLYGLDMSIEVTKRLVEKGLPVNFIYTVSSLDQGAERFQKSQEQIKAFSLTNDFLLVNEKISFVRLIESTDIVLRPTNTDGDALTVREALFLGKKVLASDIVERPAGTVLFKTRDINDLESKLEFLIHQGINSKVEHNNNDKEEYRKYYSGLIHELVS